MDLRSLSEHKQICPTRGENNVITVHQGKFLYQLDSFYDVCPPLAFIIAWHLHGMLDRGHIVVSGSILQ